jgi:NADH-quinone oxidoreductase subunit E
MFMLEEAECLAGCDKAVCVQVNHRFFGPVDQGGFRDLVAELAAGKLEDTVPRHGVLNRVKRAVGLPAKDAADAQSATKEGAPL